MEKNKIIFMLVDILEECGKMINTENIKGYQALEEKIGLSTMIAKDTQYAKLLDNYLWGNKYK